MLSVAWAAHGFFPRLWEARPVLYRHPTDAAKVSPPPFTGIRFSAALAKYPSRQPPGCKYPPDRPPEPVLLCPYKAKPHFFGQVYLDRCFIKFLMEKLGYGRLSHADGSYSALLPVFPASDRRHRSCGVTCKSKAWLAVGAAQCTCAPPTGSPIRKSFAAAPRYTGTPYPGGDCRRFSAAILHVGSFLHFPGFS